MSTDEKQCISPSQESSQRLTPSIEEMRAKLLRMASVPKSSIKTKIKTKSGKPLFKILDIIKTINPMAKLVRMIFIDKGITDDEFKTLHHDYEISNGRLYREIGTIHNNLRRTLLKPTLTVESFEKTLPILGWKIVDMGYTLQDTRTGEIKEYKISDLRKFIEERYDGKIEEEDLHTEWGNDKM